MKIKGAKSNKEVWLTMRHTWAYYGRYGNCVCTYTHYGVDIYISGAFPDNTGLEFLLELLIQKNINQ